MNPLTIVLFAFLGSCVVTLATALLIDYTRALGIARAENFELRRRLQVARLVIDDLVEHPSDAALKLAHAWIEQENTQQPPPRIARWP